MTYIKETDGEEKMIMSEPIIKFTRGVPAIESFNAGQLSECAKSAMEKYCDVVMQYGPAGGFPPLRSWIAKEAGVSENCVIIGQGSLQLQDMLARLLFQNGDLVYVEEPTYDRAATVLRRAGAKITGFRVADDGVDVDAVEAHLRKGEKPRLFYIIPDFQNPSGVVMSLDKRKRIAALAEQYGFYIVEDVPYRKLRYSGEECQTLFDLSPDRVVQMSSFSKLIGPGLRVGYAIAPESLAEKLCKYAEDTYINASYLTHAIVYEFIERDWFLPNLAALKALYAPRLATILKSLEENMGDLATWQKPEGGFFVGMTIKAEVNADQLLERAKAANLQLTNGRGFFVNGGGDNFVRLPFCALKPDEIKSGIARLAEVIKSL